MFSELLQIPLQQQLDRVLGVISTRSLEFILPIRTWTGTDLTHVRLFIYNPSLTP